jgi:hypothetical protein
MRFASLVLAVVPVALALTACGGGSKPANQPAPAGRNDDQAVNGTVVPAEAMDEIGRSLDRKRNVVARCLSAAVDAGELPKNAHGRITLGFVISPAGKAGDIKVIKTSLESQTLTDCVIGHVTAIEFPTIPDPLPWSYTYGFEAT